ncbi:S-methyl-5-thioribose kinase [Rheinheimera sp. 1928-s]|uniref:S-methyl-5-thioribose kinase n=1 Tax=Rheinheimera sp. 1928-s TaxID=3033803 RepID=UPI00261C913D|nr:S-methyl-5-thioribose kinase [Rheinheimera sp. 1928-s]MDF3127022.1 S-methyl-5-thioribose kinase [Rheinheimera sp. 1928-s]
MPYQALTPKEAALFADKHSDLFGDHSQLTTELLKNDGMNQVFRVKNNRGTSLIVKQALPEPSTFTQHWPVSLNRAQIEADVLKHHAKICPDYLVEVLFYDAQLFALLLEDLSDCISLRTAIATGVLPQDTGLHLGRYLANTCFYSSDFVLTGPVKKARQLQFSNPELSLVIEDLVFTDPYCNHERNSLSFAQRPQVQELWFNETLQAEVAQLKAGFLAKPQALLHGDLHCGNVLVNHQQHKIISAEFGCYGPIGFDTGTFLASLILNLLTPEPARETALCHYLLSQIELFWQEFSAVFSTLMQKQTTDQSFQNASYQQWYLQQLWQDTLGYAGCELIRRAIGWAPAEELKQLKDEAFKQQAQQQILALGQKLITERQQMTLQDLLSNIAQ